MALALLLRSASLLPWALVALGAEYAAGLALHAGSGVDTRAPLYGAGLLLAAELGYWSIARRSAAWAEPQLLAWRVLGLALLTLAAVGLGTLVLAVGAIPVGGGVALEALGVAAAVGLVALLARLVALERPRDEL